jgi:uncharacterized protein YaiE (UPF0345 family)
VGISQIFDNGTNVGIATTALVADALLPIQINAGSSGQAYFASNNNGGYGLLMGYDNANGYARIRNVSNTALTFETNNSEKMRITNSGNLGLGATPSAWNSNSRALQLPQFVSLSNQNNGSLNLMSFALETSSETFTYADTGVFPLRYNQNPNNGNHSWYVAPTGTSGNTITFTQAMTLDASGRLGIGTASPSARFHVANSAGGVVAFLQSTATNGEPSLSLEGRNSSGTVRNGIFKYDNADILRIGTSSPISFRFETNDTERMIIFSDGKVFIGSSSSNNGQQLRVNGNVEVTASNAFRASYDNSDNYHGALTWATLQLGNNGNNRIIGGRTAAGGFLQFYVNTTNDCTNYSTVPNGTLALTLAATGEATFNNTLSVAGKTFAPGFTSRTGSISIAAGVTSTITTMDVNGLFLVNIQVNGGSLIFNATNYFMANNTNSQYVNAGSLYDGANVTLSNSGSAIQITNNGFSTLIWHWSVFVMPYAAI